MSDRWKHDNFHKNPQQPEEHCPYCRIRELETDNVLVLKHWEAEERGDLCFNEVTGLHAEADLYRIRELEAIIARNCDPADATESDARIIQECINATYPENL